MFEKLRGFIGDNPEAIELLKGLEETTTGNVNKINNLETQLVEVKGTRDKFKGGNSLVKSILGLDAVNEETLNEFINSSKGKSGDEKLVAEIDNLKELLTKSSDENQNLTNGYETKLSTMALNNAIANSGVGANVANEAMFTIVTDLIKQGASFEDGNIVYKNADGSTAYGANNQPMTIEDKMNSLKTDANYAGLFKPDVNGGSGTNTNNHSGGVGTMTRAQFEQTSPEAQSRFMSDGGSLKD